MTENKGYFKQAWEKFLEPNYDKHPKLCVESRQMLKTCIQNSKCFRETEDFKSCAKDNMNAECVPHRIDYFRCKRYLVDRTKDFRRDPRHGI